MRFIKVMKKVFFAQSIYRARVSALISHVNYEECLSSLVVLDAARLIYLGYYKFQVWNRYITIVYIEQFNIKYGL